MIWAHTSNISLHELTQVAAGFLDILVLASGVQSSGRPAIWEAESIRRALRWAEYLERAMLGFPSTKHGESSREAFEMALVDLMDVSPHPPGLPHLSHHTLLAARALLVRTLVQALRDQHLGSIISQVAQEVEPKKDRKRSFDAFHQQQHQKLSELVSDEVCTRQSTRQCLNSVSRALESATESVVSSKVVTRTMTSIWKQDPSSSSSGICELSRRNCCQCELWCKNAVAYWTSPTTIYKLAGAARILDCETSAWKTVLDCLTAAGEEQHHRVFEVAELCLLYLTSDRWKATLNKLLLWFSPSKTTPAEEHVRASEEALEQRRGDVEEYVLGLIRSSQTIWWKLPAILAAAAAENHRQLRSRYVKSMLVHRTGLCSNPLCKRDRVCSSCRDAVCERAWCLKLLNTLREDSDQSNAIQSLYTHARQAAAAAAV